MSKLVYIAAPYSDPDRQVVEDRMIALMKVDAVLTNAGLFTVSPLSKHFCLAYGSIPSDWNYWQHYSHELMSTCGSMIVVTLPGWSSSVDVMAELIHAEKIGLPYSFVDECGTPRIDLRLYERSKLER